MGNKLNLDKLDMQIIHEMMDNAEISYAELGKKLFFENYEKRPEIKISW